MVVIVSFLNNQIIISCIVQEVWLQDPLVFSIGSGSDAFFPCGLPKEAESPYWKINGTIYTFDQVPPRFQVFGYAGLAIQAINETLNGFTFQCIGFDISRQNVIVEERATILRVKIGM